MGLVTEEALFDYPRCIKCNRPIPEGESICPCWSAEELIEFGIDPVGWRKARPGLDATKSQSPGEIALDQSMQAIKEETLRRGYHDVPPREMRKEDAEASKRGTLSLREEILQIKGHMAWLEQKLKEELQAKKKGKYSKYE